jgi:hypothetical protein
MEDKYYSNNFNKNLHTIYNTSAVMKKEAIHEGGATGATARSKTRLRVEPH